MLLDSNTNGNNMNSKYIVLILVILSQLNFAQDDIIKRTSQITMGIGYDINPPSYGIHLTGFYKVFNFGFTYDMPVSSSEKVIQEIKNGFIIKAGIAPLFFLDSKYIFPIYIGFGYSLINEKDKVLEFSGDGKINGYHYFAGFKVLPGKSDFWGSFGAHLELGYSSWNYDDSILKKNNSETEYNYSKFFFSIGLSYYFL